MSTAFRQHLRQHLPGPLRWLVWLLAAVLLMVLLAGLAAWAFGLRVQGVGWQQGLQVAGWQLRQQDCIALQGRNLSLSALRPVRIHLDSLALKSCDTEPAQLKPPPWTPPFDLHVDRILRDGLPPLSLDVRQREQLWHIVAQHEDSHVVADYDRADGQWEVAGGINGRHLLPELLGRLELAGEGYWLADRLDGSAQVHGEALGYAGRPQRADAMLTATLAKRVWTLDADLTSPLALAAGWQVAAHKAVQARGTFDGLTSLTADLQASGPQGQARLVLDGEAGGLRGQGRLVLSGPELGGTLPLRWLQRELTLAPATLKLPSALQLTLPEPVVIPLAATGRVALSAVVRRVTGKDQLSLTTRGSELTWGQGAAGKETAPAWSWQGVLNLAGHQSGQQLTGHWQGRADPAGLTGGPVQLGVQSRELQLTAVVPVAGIKPPSWPLQATFKGRYGAYPLAGSLSAVRGGSDKGKAGDWQGVLRAQSRLALYDKGGALDLNLPWVLPQDGIQARSGGRLSVAEGLKGTLLIKPLTLTVRSPLRPAGGGVNGELTLDSGGLVAARAGLPALTGVLKLAGRGGMASLQVPSWQSHLDFSAVLPQGASPRGTATLATPLTEAMSKGLGFTLKQGQLAGKANWTWQDAPALQGEAAVSGLAMDWGGIGAAGGQGRLQFQLRDGKTTLASIGPITLASLQVGTPVTDISLGLSGDLETWRLSDVSARALGGHISAPALHWPATDHQTVMLTGIDLGQVAALQGGDSPPVQLAGNVGGELPVLLGKGTLSLQGGLMRNEGPLSLRITPSAGVVAMSQSNRAVQFAMDTLSNLLVSDFLARLDMAPDGWLDAAVTIKGASVQPNSQPVVLNYTHRENVLELLRSLRIGDEISQQVMDRQKGKP